MRRQLSKTRNFGFVCLVTFLTLGLQQVQAQQQSRKFQEFDIVQDYKGAKHLVLQVLVNLQQGTSAVIISQRLDSESWVEIGSLNVQREYKASTQNTPLSIELDEVGKLLQNIKSQVSFRLIPINQGKREKACNFAHISKDRLLSLQAMVDLDHHLAQRNK